MTIESLIEEYARRYSTGDVEAVTDMCLLPFMAIRGGIPIPLADREAVRDHFTSMIEAYRSSGFASFSPVEIKAHHLGASAAFVTVRWHALGTDGVVQRDSHTTYHVLADAGTWRFLSYTNHF